MLNELLHFALQTFSAQAILLQGLLFNPGSSFSLASLFCAFCMAFGFLTLGRRGGWQDIKLKTLLRVMFPPRLVKSPSGRADIAFLVLNGTVAGAILSGAFLSSTLIGRAVGQGLEHLLGPSPALPIGALGSRVVATVGLFLAYELGYWTNHYISHRIPALWEFHRVHHTAESLSPITNFRTHPVDSIVFGNFIAVFTGVGGGCLAYLFGRPALPFTIGQSNAIFTAFTFLLVHLQHSQFWIPATGLWARLIISPAHHQLHHSIDPGHHDRNFGSCLAIWDWMFGTLVAPTRDRPSLTFGVDPAGGSGHSALELVAKPFVRSWRRSVPALRGQAAPNRPNSE